MSLSANGVLQLKTHPEQRFYLITRKLSSVTPHGAATYPNKGVSLLPKIVPVIGHSAPQGPYVFLPIVIAFLSGAGSWEHDTCHKGYHTWTSSMEFQRFNRQQLT
jgi:hypothetical protein